MWPDFDGAGTQRQRCRWCDEQSASRERSPIPANQTRDRVWSSARYMHDAVLQIDFFPTQSSGFTKPHAGEQQQQNEITSNRVVQVVNRFVKGREFVDRNDALATFLVVPLTLQTSNRIAGMSGTRSAANSTASEMSASQSWPRSARVVRFTLADLVDDRAMAGLNHVRRDRHQRQVAPRLQVSFNRDCVRPDRSRSQIFPRRQVVV